MNYFQRPGPATSECDGSQVQLEDPKGLLALGPANSNAAFPRAGKELDIQIISQRSSLIPLLTHPWHGGTCLHSSKKLSRTPQPCPM